MLSGPAFATRRRQPLNQHSGTYTGERPPTRNGGDPGAKRSGWDGAMGRADPASSSMDKDAGNDYRPQAIGLASDKDTCVEYKPMCHAWFDRLFLALHRDFMELDTWRAQEGKDAAESGLYDERHHGAGPSSKCLQTGSTGCATMGSAEGRELAGSDSSTGPPSLMAPHELWLSRAKLADRLLLPAEARMAYTRAVQSLEALLDGTDAHAPAEGDEREMAELRWSQACTRLIELHTTEEGEEGVILAGSAAVHPRLRIPPSIGASPSVDCNTNAPSSCRCGLQTHLCPRLQHVRTAKRSIGEPHPILNHIFHEVVQWKVRGFDR